MDYWYAPEHAVWGKQLTTQIDQEIRVRGRVILVCSESSLHDSDWVRYEIDKAIEEEKQRGKRVLFPVMLDGALLNWEDPRANRVRQVLAGDFRKATKGKAFLTAMKHLIEGLRSDDKEEHDPSP